MDLPIRMRIICTVKHHYATVMKLGNKFSTSLIKLGLEVKASICSTTIDPPFILLLNHQNFLGCHNIRRSASKTNIASNKKH